MNANETSSSPDARKARALIERYTVHSQDCCQPSEEIVLVPDGADLAEGFARAKALLSAGATVRLVGLGVTVPGIRPRWVDDARGLALTELWAYRDRRPVDATAEQCAVIEKWLDEVFGDTVRGLAGADVFFSAACHRVFQRAIQALPEILGVVRHSTADTFHIVGGDWIGLPVLRNLVAIRGGRVVVEGRSEPRWRLPWRASIGTMGGAALAGTVLDQLRAYVMSRQTRTALQGLRRHPAQPKPDTWLVLIANWPRFSRVLIDSVARPELARGRKLGLLLAGSLVPGTKDEAAMRRRLDAELWPGLGALKHELESCVVDQVVGPETLRDLVGALSRSLAMSTRALRRLARSGPRIGSGSTEIDLRPHVFGLAKLATLDVARAIQADLATREVVRRHELNGQCVVMAASSTAEMVTADLLLQSAGASTVELTHGSLGTGEPGARRSKSQRVCVWTHPDAQTQRPLEQTYVVAGLPPLALPRRIRSTVERILFLSNYVHHGYRVEGRQPLEPLQLELLRAAPLARRAVGPNAEVRWRPHPADDREAVARTMATVTNVECSVGRDLTDDVAWADIIVCTPSSTLYQAVLADVPVFLHLTPDYAETPIGNAIVPSRTFFFAEELVPKLSACLDALKRGDPDALAAERQARTTFFGPGGQPKSFAEVVLDDDVSREKTTSRRHRA